MQRFELEHTLRAAGDIAKMDEFIIIGSQAILGQFPSAPAVFLKSNEADMYPRQDPDKAIEIDGAIGERSIFHITNGYYVHGVGPDTAVLPPGWEDRLIPVCNENTRNIKGQCLEVHDLAISKLIAGRDKDLEFVKELLSHKMANASRLEQLAKTVAVPQQLGELLLHRIWRLEGEVAAPNPPLAQSLDATGKPIPGQSKNQRPPGITD
jgi:hypothetical protein